MRRCAPVMAPILFHPPTMYIPAHFAETRPDELTRIDERFVRGVVGRLTKRHEAGESVPWKMSGKPTPPQAASRSQA